MKISISTSVELIKSDGSKHIEEGFIDQKSACVYVMSELRKDMYIDSFIKVNVRKEK